MPCADEAILSARPEVDAFFFRYASLRSFVFRLRVASSAAAVAFECALPAFEMVRATRCRRRSAAYVRHAADER